MNDLVPFSNTLTPQVDPGGRRVRWRPFSGQPVDLLDVILLLMWVGAIGSSFALAFRPIPLLFEYPMVEDGYLALSIARNIGIGHGVTYDGHTPTNGFQPLWVFLCSPLFSIVDGDRELGVRLVTGLQGAIFVLSGAVWAWGVGCATRRWHPLRRRRLVLATGAIYLCSYDIWLNCFTGMETGLLFRLY